MAGIQIVPAILTSSPQELDTWLQKIKDTQKYERVQVDFIDGEYARNRTIKPTEVDLIPYFPMKFDAHLMVVEDNVLTWGKVAEKMGFDRVIPQLESISAPEDFTGLAMDVHSPVAAIEPYLDSLSVVVVMAVEPGFGGQEFVNLAVNHVKELAALRKEKGWDYRICVDGGIEQLHVPFLEEWGADEVAVGVKRCLEWA